MFKISACTNAGCLTDVRGAIVETKMDVPEDQFAPTITALSATELLVQWQPPQMSNGINCFKLFLFAFAFASLCYECVHL